MCYPSIFTFDISVTVQHNCLTAFKILSLLFRLVSTTANELTWLPPLRRLNRAGINSGTPPLHRTTNAPSPRRPVLLLEPLLLPFTVFTTWACEAYILCSAMKPKKDGYGIERKFKLPPARKLPVKARAKTLCPKRCFPRPGSVPIIDVKRAR